MKIIFVFLIFINSPLWALDLALNWKAEPQFGGFYQAQLDGEYVNRGLDLHLLEGGSGTPTVQMLANYKVDFAVMSAEEILTNNDKNPKNKVVALFAAFQMNPQIIMCRAENKFKNLSEVFNSDATVAWQSGLTYAAFLKKKYAAKSPHFVPYLGGISPYLAESHFCQQGFLTSEPLMAEAAGHPGQVFLIAEEGFNPYTTVLATHENTLKNNPKVVKDMVAAVRNGWNHYLRDPKAGNALMATLNRGMSPEMFQKSAMMQKKLIELPTPSLSEKNKGLLETGSMEEKRWQSLIDQLYDLGVIKNKLKAADQFVNVSSQ
jgi:NitT/TauT family transport system substrate-binding protein